MKPSVEQVQNLLALKRHEAPHEGFMEDFLVEFHRRQRMEAVRTTGFAGAFRRFSEWFSDLGASRWAYAGGVAYATALAIMLALPKETPELPPHAVQVQSVVTPPREAQPAPAAAPAVKDAEQLNDLDFRPSSQGRKGEQEF